MMMSQHDWEKICKDIEPPAITHYVKDAPFVMYCNQNATVMLPVEEYEKLKQDSETLARIKEYVNNLDKQ